jgi:Calcineurin-like phosphoesterase
MPAIAAGASDAGADFYWHLGDFRAMYDFDQDYLAQPDHRGKRVAIADYQRTAWDDFIQSQLSPFGERPVFLGIGNHELVAPKSRSDFLIQFADWLDSEPIRRERLRDDPNDHRLKTWYHWIRGGIDFVNLDSASADQFEAEQTHWFEGVITRAESNAEVRAIVVGMHAALPDSLASGHSMNDWAQGEKSGRRVYARLVQAAKTKPVYILASHSHFFMSGIFGTPEKKASGDVLPGWIVGTGGAVRYALPPGAAQAKEARTNIYGYLVGTVGARGTAPGEIRFQFHETREADVPASTLSRFGAEAVHECCTRNTSVSSEPAPAAPAAANASSPASVRH